jgi:aryl-alcohol dehydrogenase-like predicted oxidoreductase
MDADRLVLSSGDLPGFYRHEQGLRISTIGIGTYRGKRGPAADASYLSALRTAFRGGINLVDTALIYRDEQSERMVGAAIREFVEQGHGQRDELVVCTKGGYLAAEVDDAAGVHSIAPAHLEDQLHRSLRNLGLTTIDVYYLHNPEVQLREVGVPEFRLRMRRAFEVLEEAVARRMIRYYGTATWGGYIDGLISLPDLAEAAREIAGDEHHFRFVQLPFSLEMKEALETGVVDVAGELGMTVIASAPLGQGRLSADLPGALQFARSAPGIAAAVVGMSSSRHVEENLAVAMRPPLTLCEFDRVWSATHTERPGIHT